VPDDARHLVAVELDDRVADRDLIQGRVLLRSVRRGPPKIPGAAGVRLAARGTAVSMRVVSLLPSSTEILFGIGAGDQVVGVTHECDYPVEATTRPALTSSLLPAELDAAGIDRHVRARVHQGSSLYGLDDVKLAALEPDLIVTQELCVVCAVSYEIVDRAAKRLRGDPRVVSLEPSSLDDVFATIAFLGDLVGAKDGAAALLDNLRARVTALQRAAERDGEDPRPRVLVLEWTDPPMSGGHWTPGLVELAGGDPVLGNPGANSRALTWDEIAAGDPDVVIVAPCGFGLARTLHEIAGLPRDAAHAFAALRAVREGRAYAMDGNAFVNRPGPRLVDTAELFAAAIHGTVPPGSEALAPIEAVTPA
jgi:iron complex transport system substrate-binding protein